MNYDLERECWARVFKAVLKVNPRECSLCLTEPLLNFPAVQAATEQVTAGGRGRRQGIWERHGPSLEKHMEQIQGDAMRPHQQLCLPPLADCV